MATKSFDFQVGLKAYPYVVPQPSVPVSTVDTAGAALDTLVNTIEKATAEAAASLTALKASTTVETQTSTGDQWTPALPAFPKLDAITKPIDKVMSKIDAISKVLVKVLNVLQLFITGFSSIAGLISVVLKLSSKLLKDLAADGLDLGIYINLIAPPALLEKNTYSSSGIQKLRGGFPAFISRLKNSVKDPTDQYRPTFKESEFVGGWVILIDSEKIDEIWTAIKQLSAFFKELNKFGLHLEPPPPNNLNGTCEYIDTVKNGVVVSHRLGVKLEWDNNYICTAYKLSRSKNPGGTLGLVDYIPATLVGDRSIDDEGLFPAGWRMLGQLHAGQPVVMPQKMGVEYKDPLFGSPKIIDSGLTKTISYIDYEIDPKINITPLYYVVQSCQVGGIGPGPYSKVLSVTVKNCNDMYSLADVIEYPNGSFDFLAAGSDNIMPWSSIHIGGLIPWLGDLIDIVTGILDNLAAKLGGASDSFVKFLKNIQKNIQLVLDTIKIISYILASLKNFVLGPSILMLKLSPKQGGIDNFIQRIQSAQLPAGDSGFSGPNGITIGFVAAYGASGVIVDVVQDAADIADAAAYQLEQLNAIEGTNATANAAKTARNLANTADDAALKVKAAMVKTMGTAFDFIFKLFGK